MWSTEWNFGVHFHTTVGVAKEERARIEGLTLVIDQFYGDKEDYTSLKNKLEEFSMSEKLFYHSGSFYRIIATEFVTQLF